MKSCMWTPWCLETEVGASFDGAAVRGAVEHLREAGTQYSVACWVITREDLESFKLPELTTELPALKKALEETGVTRIVLVTRHIFGETAAATIAEALGVQTRYFRERVAAHAWVMQRCPD